MTDHDPGGGSVGGGEGGGALRRLGRSLPRLLLEMLGVVFAVLVALAADEWRESHELAQRAATARAGVLAELRANRAELERTQAGLDSTASRLEAAVRADTSGDGPGLSVDLELPDFSDAAWRITQVTDAASRLDFAWLTRVARIYAAQQLYADVRGDVVSTMGALGTSGPEPGIARLSGQLRILLQLHRQLMDDYDEVLGESGS